MTIAIAAKWPWELILKLADLPPGRRINQAAILLSDSRWTISRSSTLGEGSEIHLDVGTKLFQLSNDAGAVYAGDTSAGEESMWRLERRFKQNRVNKPPHILAREMFKAIYARHRTENPLRIWVGVCDPQSRADLWFFNSDADFEPEAADGVQILAFPETEMAFREGLETVIQDSFANPSNIPLGPDRWRWNNCGN